MKPEQWREVQDLYHQASLLPEAEREAFLASQTQYSAETIAEVQALLGDGPPTRFVLPIEQQAALKEAKLDIESLGEFDLIEEIGRGGMGVVYRARQRSLGRTVAIKILPGSWALSERQVDRFQREARSVAKLSHPNIISVFSVGQEGPTHYFAMELVEGHDLRSELQNSKDGEETTLPPQGDPAHHRTIAELILAAAEALEHAHRRGVIHRDVKPSNLLLAPDGSIKVVDFGLARDEEFGAITLTGELAGTPQYMSPEQVRRKNDQVDHRTDIYSLGVVLYELLTGARPFDSSDSSKLEHDILVREARNPRARVPSIPPDLETICLKTLEKDADDRYQSAGELASDLKRFLNDEPVVAKRISAGRRFLRKLKREPRIVVAALVLISIAGLSYALGTANPGAPMGSVRFEVTDALDGAVLTAHRLNPFDGNREAQLLTGRLKGKALEFEPGLVRLELVGKGGASNSFGEFTRIVYGDQALEITPVLRPNAEVFADMIQIPAGSYTVGPPNLEIAPNYGERTLEVPGYWIDKTEVSNADYLAYLQAIPDAVRPRHWDEGEPAFPPQLAKHPVIGVTLQAAKAYAEWRGKRLPTLVEWEVAASGGQGAGYPWGDEPGDLAASAVVMRSVEETGSDQEPDIFEGYAEHSAPVDIPFGRDVSPFGLLHCFGNAREWTESPSLILAEGVEINKAYHMVKGLKWNSTAGQGKDLSIVSEYRDISHLAGFRCAKSAPDSLGNSK